MRQKVVQIRVTAGLVPGLLPAVAPPYGGEPWAHDQLSGTFGDGSDPGGFRAVPHGGEPAKKRSEKSTVTTWHSPGNTLRFGLEYRAGFGDMNHPALLYP